MLNSEVMDAHAKTLKMITSGQKHHPHPGMPMIPAKN